MKNYDNIVNEIIKRVKENRIPLEDGQFTIDGVVYATEDLDINNWMTTFMGFTFTESKRVVICKVVKIDGVDLEDLNIYIAQEQTKKMDDANKRLRYTYGETLRVRPQEEEFVCNGWVKA